MPKPSRFYLQQGRTVLISFLNRRHGYSLTKGGSESEKGARIFYNENFARPRVKALLAKLLKATMLRQSCIQDLAAIILQDQVNNKGET